MTKVVQPPSTLRIVPAGKKERVAFSKTHDLRNAYLIDMVNGGRDHCSHWQRLDHVKVRWLRHVVTGELVVVVGGPKYFLDNVASKRDDMPFNLRNFQLLLADEYKDGSGNPYDTQHKWQIQLEGYQPPAVADLSDGASLAGFFTTAPHDIQLPDFVLPQPDFAPRAEGFGALPGAAGQAAEAGAGGAGDGILAPAAAATTAATQVRSPSALKPTHLACTPAVPIPCLSGSVGRRDLTFSDLALPGCCWCWR